ncbi:autotransporter domain-containing protein [Pseudomonas sp. B2M1-30]|uniref:autotransporter outer membrane beta-barrel domain-containing protein n=1 Tax=Pseudomonas TaxID=286 RepID=UPI0021C84C53|nr:MULTISPECIES: autotransporter outer membrane beta-barrel domain-containing protein [Pseudomonas]MCU0117141.1 autotransporter domain-containing protein [Pseudomonas sp. B2M1-30]MCU7260535.1 autotransporter domain-containing protein [Pseudomonas koreensis]
MLIQHRYKLQHLVLAVALAVGCAGVSQAEQVEPQVDVEVKPKKKRKNAAKSTPPIAGSDEPSAQLEQTPSSPAPSIDAQVTATAEPIVARAPIVFDEAFYEAVGFDHPTPTNASVATENNFDSFQHAYTTQHTPLSERLENNEGLSLQLGEADDLLVINNGARWDGLIDGGAGQNGLLLNAREGGEIGRTNNFKEVRVAKGAWTLGHDFNGSAEVKAGAALVNNGSIKGDALVDPSATYAGNGDVQNLYVNGALLALKDNGPTIRGNLALSRGAEVIYVVSASEGASPIVVNGTATLGNATLNVLGIPGDHAPRTDYTVLNAGKIEGEFGQVKSSLAFMTPTLAYSDTQATLTYARNDVRFEDVSGSKNAQALGKSIDEPQARPSAAKPDAQKSQAPQPQTSRPAALTHAATSPATAAASSIPGNAAVAALLTSDKATAVIALEQLAGSGNANLAKATLSSVTPVNASLLSAMHQLDNFHGSQRNAPRHAAGSADTGRVWLQALGHGGKLDRDVEPMQHTTKGLLVGADWRLNEAWRLGVMGGTSDTRMDSRELDGELDSWHLGAYALRQSGPMSLRLGATWSSHEGSTRRQVAFGRFTDRLKGNYDASTQQAFAELGYNLGRGGVRLEPFASVGYQRYQHDGYTENGGAAALKVQDQTQGNLNSTFGLRLAKVATLDNGMRLTPRFSAGWKHVYGDTETSTRQRLVTGGRDYTLYGAELDRNSLTLDTGLDLSVSTHHTLGLGLTGEIGTDSRNHGISGQWRMAF